MFKSRLFSAIVIASSVLVMIGCKKEEEVEKTEKIETTIVGPTLVIAIAEVKDGGTVSSGQDIVVQLTLTQGSSPLSTLSYTDDYTKTKTEIAPENWKQAVRLTIPYATSSQLDKVVYTFTLTDNAGKTSVKTLTYVVAKKIGPSIVLSANSVKDGATVSAGEEVTVEFTVTKGGADIKSVTLISGTLNLVKELEAKEGLQRTSVKVTATALISVKVADKDGNIAQVDIKVNKIASTVVPYESQLFHIKDAGNAFFCLADGKTMSFVEAKAAPNKVDFFYYNGMTNKHTIVAPTGAGAKDWLNPQGIAFVTDANLTKTTTINGTKSGAATQLAVGSKFTVKTDEGVEADIEVVSVAAAAPYSITLKITKK